MNNKDLSPLDELFNAKLEDFSVPPPPSVWEGVVDNLQQQQDAAARALLAEHKVTPSAQAWDNIRKRLPLIPVLRQYLNALSGIAALLLLGLLGYTLFSRFNENDAPTNGGINTTILQTSSNAATTSGANASLEQNNQVDLVSNKKLLQNIENEEDVPPTQGRQQAENVPVKKSPSQNKAAVPPKTPQLGNAGNVQGADASLNKAVVPNDSPTGTLGNDATAGQQYFQRNPLADLSFVLFETLPSIAVTWDKVIQNELWMAPFIPATDNLPVHPGVSEGGKIKKFYAEAFGQAQSTWIFNKTLRSEVLSGGGKYAFTPGYALGGGLGYRINKGLSIQVEIVAESNQGQRFTGNGGQSATLRQHFLYLPILLKWQPLAKLTSSKAHWSYLAGLQYGYQRTSTTPNDPSQLRNYLVKNELGLVLGTECTWNLTDHLGLLVGARVNVGSDLTRLNRLFSHDNSINAGLGLRVGLLWQFGKVMP